MDANSQFWLEVWKLIVTAFVAIVVGAVTAWIANSQRKIAASQRDIAKNQSNTAAEQRRISQAKLNLDLFEERYELFEHVWGFLSRPIDYDRIQAHRPDFTNLIPKAQFLFGAEIAEYMREASKRQIELATLLLVSNQRALDNEERRSLSDFEQWFVAEATNCFHRFSAYLDFSVWRAQ